MRSVREDVTYLHDRMLCTPELKKKKFVRESSVATIFRCPNREKVSPAKFRIALTAPRGYRSSTMTLSSRLGFCPSKTSSSAKDLPSSSYILFLFIWSRVNKKRAPITAVFASTPSELGHSRRFEASWGTSKRNCFLAQIRYTLTTFRDFNLNTFSPDATLDENSVRGWTENRNFFLPS